MNPANLFLIIFFLSIGGIFILFEILIVTNIIIILKKHKIIKTNFDIYKIFQSNITFNKALLLLIISAINGLLIYYMLYLWYINSCTPYSSCDLRPLIFIM